MDQDTFCQTIETILCPLLGSYLVDGYTKPSSPREKFVSFAGGGVEIELKRAPSANKVKIKRAQRFSANELRIAQDFCAEIVKITEFNKLDYENILIQNISNRIIVKQFPRVQNVLREIIDQFNAWSSQTYEGKQIVYAIGINPNDEGQIPVTLNDFWKETYSPVLTNGYDTMLLVSSEGQLVKFEPLGDSNSHLLAPFRHQYFAQWATSDRVVVVLNQHGEILIFADQTLRFAKRRGVWLHYYIDCVTARLYPPKLSKLRTAILESCIDVSFSRTGACIGIIYKSKTESFRTDGIIKSKENFNGIKSVIFQEIKTRPFHELDRRLRQELLAVDGATVLDHNGNILAIGEILKVNGADFGGGRTLAAKTLSSYGLGIKVSADGPISGYKDQEQIFSL